MVVEDDPFHAEILNLLLRELGSYETLYFENAYETLNHLDDIVVCRPLAFIFDYCLPYLNGLDLSRRLHEVQGLEATPTIILTALKMDESKQEPVREQPVTFVFKPYDINDLLATVQRVADEASASTASLRLTC